MANFWFCRLCVGFDSGCVGRLCSNKEAKENEILADSSSTSMFFKSQEGFRISCSPFPSHEPDFNFRVRFPLFPSVCSATGTMTPVFVAVRVLLLSAGISAAVRSCGRRVSDHNLIGRVVGGHPASFGEIPWQASIQESRLWGLLEYRKCGAVVIHQNWLLTAAHCTTTWYFSELFITMGEHEMEKNVKRKNVKNNDKKKKDNPDLLSNRATSMIQKRKVKRIVIHPMFSPFDLEDDIALIELDKPLEFSPNIQPVCLPQKNANFTRAEGLVSGWGFTAYRK